MLTIMKHFQKRDWLLTFIVFLLTIVEVVTGLFTIMYMEKIVDLVMKNADMSVIFRDGGIMVAFSLVSVLIGILISFITVKVSTGYAKRLRSMLFERVNSFGKEEINTFSLASLITRSTNDIQTIQTAVTNGLRMIFVAPIVAVGAIIMIVDKSHTLTLTTAVGIIVLVISIAIIFMVVSPKFKVVQRYTDELNGISREHLTGLRVVRAYNAEEYQEQKFDSTNKKLSRLHRFVARTMGLLMPLCNIIMNVLGLSIIWIGSYLINDGALTLPEMTAFELYANMVLMAFMMMTMIVIMLPRAVISAKRVNEVLATEPNITDPENVIVPDPSHHGEVEFRHVSFRYPNAKNYALHDISFTLKPGETLAIIGSTGSGKSTLINLIPRFYDVTDGAVLVDGVDVREQAGKALRDKIGLVPQEAMLFSGSIAHNIRYGNEDMSDECMTTATRIAEAESFILAKEDGYNSNVSQGGKNFSGGQRQRLSIARAIAKQGEIFIFDDSFSALDYATDKRVRTSLGSVTKDASVIIVAQRIGTIMNADKIIVLDKGEMVGYGTHEELLATSSVYQEIALSQLTQEELDNASRQ